MMGPFYEPARRVWNKNEFNAQNDLEALDLLLNTKDLELHIMPAGMAGNMVFTRSETLKQLQANDEVMKFLLAGFTKSAVNTDSVNMASVSLVQALFNPEMASEKQVFPPPENNQRKVSVYTRIDAGRMKKDYWKAIEKYIETN